MKYKIIGWTTEDDHNFPDLSFISKNVINIILDELVKNKYLFAGKDHQDLNCVPVLNNGYKVVFSRRGWGQIIADVLQIEQNSGYEYASFTESSDFEKHIGEGNVTNAPSNVIIDKKLIKPQSVLADNYFIKLNKETSEIINNGGNTIRTFFSTLWQRVDRGDSFDIITDDNRVINCFVISYREEYNVEYLLPEKDKFSETNFYYLVTPKIEQKYSQIVAYEQIILTTRENYKKIVKHEKEKA